MNRAETSEEYVNEVMSNRLEAESLIASYCGALDKIDQLKRELDLAEKAARLQFKAPSYYLIDFERTVAANRPFYWRPNVNGYTNNVKEAGLYDGESARRLVLGDVNGRTFAISEQDLKTILIN